MRPHKNLAKEFYPFLIKISFIRLLCSLYMADYSQYAFTNRKQTSHSRN